jgi:hypothetical protein
MLIKEVVTINGIEYNHTYSDAGFYIERDGVEYSDAIDPIDIEREYIETDRKIENENHLEELETNHIQQTKSEE